MRLNHTTHKSYYYHNKLQSQLANKNHTMLLLVHLYDSLTNLVAKQPLSIFLLSCKKLDTF